MDTFYFSCLNALARTSNTMWNRRGDSEHPCLVPNLRGKACRFIILDQIFLWETVRVECLAKSLTSNSVDANSSPNHNVKNASPVTAQSLVPPAKGGEIASG